MRTYHLELSVELRAVVPDQFFTAQLEASRADDRTPFQQQLIEKYDAALDSITPDFSAESAEQVRDDAADAFLMELLGNGLRHGIRGHILTMLESSGVGGTVAPVKLLQNETYKPQEVAVES